MNTKDDDKIQMARNLETKRNRRSLTIVSSVVFIVIGLALFYSDAKLAKFLHDDMVYYSGGKDRHIQNLIDIVDIFAFLISLMGISLITNYYLKYGLFKNYKGILHDDFDKLLLTLKEVEDRNNSSFSISKNINSKLDSFIREYNDKYPQLNDKDRHEIKESILSKIKEETCISIMRSIENKIKTQLSTDDILSFAREHTNKLKDRLRSEVEAQERRGRVNLIIGGVTAIIGTYIFGFILFSTDPSLYRSINAKNNIKNEKIESTISQQYSNKEQQKNTQDVEQTTANSNKDKEYITTIASISSRISLVFIIELFALFFLRVYRSSLDEIKYFQNELTNIDMKIIGLQTAIVMGDKKTISETTSSLISTERNFKLSKGESTVELEKSRLDTTMFHEIFSLITGNTKKDHNSKL